jgi:uncharacterized protein (TIGR00251 family)
VRKGSDSRTADLPVWLRSSSPQELQLALYVQPGARRTDCAGLHADRLKIAVATPPIDGRANQALLAFIAETLQLPRSAVQLTAGEHSRLKRVTVRSALLPEQVAQRLAGQKKEQA